MLVIKTDPCVGYVTFYHPLVLSQSEWTSTYIVEATVRCHFAFWSAIAYDVN